MTRKRGIVRWMDRLKGFGFIEAQEGTSDIFIHFSKLEDGYTDLYIGDEVTYEEVDVDDVPQAQKVRRA